MTVHPAALVLADHQPIYVTASTAPGTPIRCCCLHWSGPWCEFGTHQAAALAGAGLLAEPPEEETEIRIPQKQGYMGHAGEGRLVRRLVCGRCGAVALLDGPTPTAVPQDWEWFMVRGELRYACPACIETAT